MCSMTVANKETARPAVARVVILNPAILDRIRDAAQRGIGRNATEAAENLILAGCDALRTKDQASTSVAR